MVMIVHFYINIKKVMTINYIIVDFEWNNGTTEYEKESPLKFEIIEFGAVKLDKSFQVIDTFESLVKPCVFRSIHPIIQKITGIHIDELMNQDSFVDVMTKFMKWCGNNFIFCTFGSQDLWELQSNMEYHGMIRPDGQKRYGMNGKQDISICYNWKYPLLYLDIQKLLQYHIQRQMRRENATEPETKDVKQMSLEHAIEYLNIPIHEPFHRACVDALYTAKVMGFLEKDLFIKHKSLDYYCIPKKKKEEKTVKVGKHLEYVTCAFQDKEQVLKKKKLFHISCPRCKKNVNTKVSWFADGGKHICVGKCQEHGYVEGMFCIKQNPVNSGYFGIQRMKLISIERYRNIDERKKHLVEKKKQKQMGSDSD